jgi:Ca-activated chloride channel family protein
VLAASAQDFQIRTRVDLVVVPVSVKASGDKLITGLQKEDFMVLEDNQRQTITNFTTDPVPLSAAVVVDTGLSADALIKVQQTFPALAGAFSQFDEVAVYRFSKDVVKIIDFTKDLDAVETAMKTLREIKPDTPISVLRGGPFSTAGPVINGAPVVPPGQVGTPITQQQAKAKVLNDALFAAATDLAKRERDRRKMAIVVSAGTSEHSDHSFEETVNSLLDSDVQVYAITLDQTILTRKFTALNDYASTTGGDSFYVGSSVQSIETGYARATEQARNQYVLGYVSDNKITGTQPVFRTIQVKLAGADYDTVHRKGYYQYP